MTSACADRLAAAVDVAQQASMEYRPLKAGIFHLTSFSRLSDSRQPITIYIEGDGAAWISPSEPAIDPTPHEPMLLRLATLDTSANVVYLARPCQYTHDDVCNISYWTQRRFAPEVVDSISAAIDQVKQQNQKAGIRLVGYSGGGAVAALVAARRHDIIDLRTIAGNLDPVALNTYHGVSPMAESLDPMKIAPHLTSLPQQHFVGSDDPVVPRFVAEHFVAAEGQGACATIVTVPQATHAKGWDKVWQQQAAQYPACP